MEIHVSDLNLFTECRRKWLLSSKNKRSLVPKKKNPAFFLGSAFHYGAEYYYQYGDYEAGIQKFIEEELENGNVPEWQMPDLLQLIEDARAMLLHYVLWAKRMQGRWSDRNLKTIATEQAFQVPLYDEGSKEVEGIVLAGKIDRVVRDEQGVLWILDYKTAGSLARKANILENDIQAGAYMIGAERMFGEKLGGVIFQLVWKEIPPAVEVLKNGMLSKKVSDKLTYDWYLKAIREYHGQESEEWIQARYGDVLATYRATPNKYFKRQLTTRTPFQLRELEKDIVAIAREMTNPSTRLYPNVTYNCNFCRYKKPCDAWNDQSEVENIINQEYEHGGVYKNGVISLEVE